MNTKNRMVYPGGFDTTIPARALAHASRKGMELVDLQQLGILPVLEGAANQHGFHLVGDVVTQLADGTPINQIWADYGALLNQVNQSRDSLVDFLTYNVTNPTELVSQPGDGVDFEEATELGVPVASRANPNYFQLGYPFKWYDLGSRYSWQYLSEATQQMVDSVANAAVEAFSRKRMFEMMKALFNNVNSTATINGNAYNVYRFYNADGTVPPTYKTNTFTGSHTHYVQSGAATVDPGDLNEILDDFASHGYTTELGYRTVIMVNKAEGDVIRTFKSPANGGTGSSRFDFIPAQGQPSAILLPNQSIIGQGPVNPNIFGSPASGLNVIGMYGNAYILQDDWMPAGYVFGFATGGEKALTNPLGLRQHAQASLQGLRLVKGKTPDYPLIDSYWIAGFGFGVRQRGSGYLIKIGSTGYAPPAMYT